MLDIDGFYFKRYKSFNDDKGVKFDQIKNINLIIGKNNSGKSSFIDIINFIYNTEDYKQNVNMIESLIVKKNIDLDEMNSIFDNKIPQEFFIYLNRPISIALLPFSNKILEKKFENGIFGQFTDDPEIISRIQLLASRIDLLKGFIFRRLSSERDIVKEAINDNGSDVDKNGNGATKLIGQYLTASNLDEKEIEVLLLNELNKIMYPDARFKRIYIQETAIASRKWEIYLEEETSRGRFPLSQTGSGLKTIILVLLNLITIPNISKKGLDKYIFAFEEIENNLHPALQRRIFEYLYNFSVKNDTHIFITTHSHVAINTFSEKEKAQIIHITKEDDTSKVNVIENHVDKIKILDDLDVRASDIFQSNGIIWVEGPTDRIYIKKWIELFSDGQYEEGNHYHFLYYGGKLLSHYEANPDPNEINDFINILKINRNAVMVIDSDKKEKNSEINSTKQRIKDECSEIDLQCWITEGKEIENYLPKEAINNTFNGTDLEQCEQYELFPDYISPIDQNFADHKVDFAHKVVENITKVDSENVLDLKDQIEDIIDSIKKWNPEL